MDVLLIHPPLAAEPSGGHRYNRALLKGAARQGMPLLSLPWTGDQPLPVDARVRLWDSLLLQALAESPPSPGVQGLLVHYLPFEDPTLDVRAREEAASLFARAADRAAFFVATGAGIARRLESRYAPRPTILAEPGVDDAFFAAEQKAVPAGGVREPVRLVTVANLLPAKGHWELLEALAGIRHLHWEWHLAGNEQADPFWSARFFERCRRLDLDRRIVRHGMLGTGDLARLLAGCDCCVSASRYESYGMALAEAVAAGLPVLATDVGEARRIAGDGIAGRVVPVDAPDRLEDALRELVEDRSLRMRLREGARSLMPRIWSQVLEDLWAGIQKLGV